MAVNLDQSRFLALHAGLVVRWHWIFGGGTLRAFDDYGRSASISANDFAELVDLGLCVLVGSAGVRLTA